MAIRLDIMKFSGAGTQTALRQAQKINDNYGEVINSIQQIWNKIDSWSSTTASGSVLKKTVKGLAEWLNNIPEPDGNNANGALQDRTDKIIDDANYEDQVNNEGNAQVSNPFQQRHLNCSENVPETRPYDGIDDFTGLTDEGVADIDTFYNSLNELEGKVNELFSIMAEGSVGTHVTGLSLDEAFKSRVRADKEALSESINNTKTIVDQYVKDQESSASNRHE